ncbi:DUF881 domain-containing protein [uncultured Mycolicibacterium sp.]|uniref:DUF881 domain-containing protein n=1 Tax=uncultured Mycolicibacterium sp. TaxID=2320817 RepID=UPI0026394B81|nr:DUF881 domain-containing protein [uncultured Mycolicibacterium sp.]
MTATGPGGRREPTRLRIGYEPDAGLNTHAAERPAKLPMPSLLRSLLNEHLDPGYAAAAAEPRRRGRAAELGWQLLAALAIAVVFAAAAAQAKSLAPAARETQRALAAGVRAAAADAEAAAAHRDELAGQVDAERRQRLEGDVRGRQLLAELDAAGVAAGATALHGPGLTVTVTDPGVTRDLSDVSKQRLPGSRQVILDRDLQLVVNSLWVAGAEAIAVDGVRIGPNVTLRQAGGGILVDNRPISSPYEIVAIGPPRAMADVFERSPGLQRLRLLEAGYGVGVQVATADDVTVPAAAPREINFAEQTGP